MKKIYFVLMIFTMIFCLTGCGNSGNETTPSSNTHQDTECGEAGGNKQITVSSIQIEPLSKTMYVKLLLPEDISSDASDYWVGGQEIGREETVVTDDGVEVELYGFYTDDTAWEDVKVYKGFQSPDNSNPPLENVKVTGEVEQIEGREFESFVEDTQVSIPVVITPYSVRISPTEDWREEGHFYQVIAIDKDGKEYYMCYLPVTDDRKTLEKKETPLTDDTDLDILGDSFSSAVETEHGGIRYIFNKKIDVDQIENIKVKAFI